MTLSDLASIGSLVSAAAVLVSLIYLGLQVNQAARNQRAAMVNGISARTSDQLLRVIRSACRFQGRCGRSSVIPSFRTSSPSSRRG